MKNMPAPIAVAWKQYQDERQSFPKLHRLIDTYEALLKYTAVLAIQNFYTVRAAEKFPDVDERIRDRITLPSSGDWANFLREVLLCFAEREGDLFCRDLFLFHFRHLGRNPRPQRSFTAQGASGRLLTLRNNYAHGATPPEDLAAALVEEYEADVSKLLDEAKFLADLPLLYVEAQTRQNEFRAQPLMGAEYRESVSLLFQTAQFRSGMWLSTILRRAPF